MIDTKLSVIASLKETFIEQVKSDVELLDNNQIELFLTDMEANARVRKLDSFTKIVVKVFQEEYEFRNASR
jgi:hypothetical protein